MAISILGTVLDQRGKHSKRWTKWRPNVSLCQHSELPIHRLELLHDSHSHRLANQTIEDIQVVSEHTQVNTHIVNFKDPWDFESVYSTLLDFAQSYPFKPSKERYFIHITTGTHVAQICLYLLTEAHYLPGALIQTSPPKKGDEHPTYFVIDLDLSKYDKIASRFRKEHLEATNFLKLGIATKNKAFNKMIEQLELVSIRSTEPILLTGPTGAGKSQLAERIASLRKKKAKMEGEFVPVNCATLKGDSALSTLFGHKKGAFTGATSDRSGLLRQADKGLIFLDEIGELGLEEQAMLLRAIEQKQFTPLGSDKEVSSDFQLIAGTNRDLSERVREGHFREDLLARIDLWTYELPSLKDRLEDLEANIDYELEKYSQAYQQNVHFNRKGRQSYLAFCKSDEALWTSNFRDLNASITRMATLSDGGRITESNANEEIERLKKRWTSTVRSNTSSTHILSQYLDEETLSNMDFYDQAKLCTIIETCKNSASMAEAGRKLFNVSRNQKASPNDSHRVKQILSKHGLNFSKIKH